MDHFRMTRDAIRATISDVVWSGEERDLTFYAMRNAKTGEVDIVDYDDRCDLVYPFSPWQQIGTKTVTVVPYTGMDGRMHLDLIAASYAQDVLEALYPL